MTAVARDEEDPRGHWSARAMAGWVCPTDAWFDVFDRPTLAKFDQPTVVDVDFARVAMSVAHWDGAALHLAASPQNASVRGTRATVPLAKLGDAPGSWGAGLSRRRGRPIAADGAVDLIVDDAQFRATPARPASWPLERAKGRDRGARTW